MRIFGQLKLKDERYVWWFITWRKFGMNSNIFEHWYYQTESAQQTESIESRQCNDRIRHMVSVKFIYSEKATKFCEISIVDLTGTT